MNLTIQDEKISVEITLENENLAPILIGVGVGLLVFAILSD